MSTNDSTIKIVETGVLIPGHQVASGNNGDPKFPGGTLAMQMPHFRQHGLDLEGYYPATLNVSFAPRRCEVDCGRADLTLREIHWHPADPAEDFSFFHVMVRKTGAAVNWVPALIYYPHPQTKPDHFQPEGMLEILAIEKIPDLSYGDAIDLTLNPTQVRIVSHSQP